MRSEEETNRALTQYADTVRRICMLYLKNQTDTEDIFQTVFMKYLLSTKQFKNREHEKAWIIRVTVNACRDWIRSFFPQPDCAFGPGWRHRSGNAGGPRGGAGGGFGTATKI